MYMYDRLPVSITTIIVEPVSEKDHWTVIATHSDGAVVSRATTIIGALPSNKLDRMLLHREHLKKALEEWGFAGLYTASEPPNRLYKDAILWTMFDTSIIVNVSEFE